MPACLSLPLSSHAPGQAVNVPGGMGLILVPNMNALPLRTFFHITLRYPFSVALALLACGATIGTISLMLGAYSFTVIVTEFSSGIFADVYDGDEHCSNISADIIRIVMPFTTPSVLPRFAEAPFLIKIPVLNCYQTFYAALRPDFSLNGWIRRYHGHCGLKITKS